MMKASRSTCSVLCLLGLIVSIISGCGKKDAFEGPAGTVSGKITYKGSPIPEGCIVVFEPEKGTIPATGVVGTDGSFSLQFEDGQDIPVDTYRISVRPPDDEEESPEDAMRRSEKKQKPKTYPQIPEKYRSGETSGETFEVKEGENPYNLDMKDGK